MSVYDFEPDCCDYDVENDGTEIKAATEPVVCEICRSTIAVGSKYQMDWQDLQGLEDDDTRHNEINSCMFCATAFCDPATENWGGALPWCCSGSSDSFDEQMCSHLEERAEDEDENVADEAKEFFAKPTAFVEQFRLRFPETFELLWRIRGDEGQ